MVGGVKRNPPTRSSMSAPIRTLGSVVTPSRRNIRCHFCGNATVFQGHDVFRGADLRTWNPL